MEIGNLLPELRQYPVLLAQYKNYPENEVLKNLRGAGLADLFFLLTVILNRPDAYNEWCFKQCRIVQNEPNECLDLWSREHYKSTIITFALTIQDILSNPEITVGLFSHTRPMAKAFLKQIKNEFENNGLLKELYSDVLYSDPKRQSPQWSDDGGLIVKRKGNPKESTIEAWGVVDGQPTSKHFELLVYDDVISRENVGNIEQIQNTTEAVKLSLNLGKKGGKRRMIGTRYAMGDTYNTFIEEKIFKPRVYAATEDGKPDGKPVFLSQEELAKKRRDLGIYLFGSQMLQNPTADSSQGFDVENLRYYEQIKPDDFNLYLIIDPATAKKKDNDYSVFTLIGLGADNNYYLVYALRDRLNLKERTKKLFELKKRFPNIKDIGYEEYGMLSDIDHIKEIQEYENYRFEIKKIHGNLHKNDRIKKLVPPMETHRFFVPNNLYYVDNDDKQQDFIKQLKDELRTFPHSSHDDILDNMSRIMHVQESKESLLCWKPEFPEIARNVAPDSDEEDFSVFDKYQ